MYGRKVSIKKKEDGSYEYMCLYCFDKFKHKVDIYVHLRVHCEKKKAQDILEQAQNSR